MMNRTTSRNLLREILRQPVGSLVELWSSGAGGAGPMGTWLVGTKTLWDVEEIVGRNVTQDRHPSRLHHELERFSPKGDFFGLGRNKQKKIVELLRRKNAERGALVRILSESMKQKTA
jgi:hypothetical protein